MLALVSMGEYCRYSLFALESNYNHLSGRLHYWSEDHDAQGLYQETRATLVGPSMVPTIMRGGFTHYSHFGSRTSTHVSLVIPSIHS